MPIDQALAALMRDSVTVEAYAGTRNGAGEKNYGAGTVYTCRVSGRNVMVRDKQGNERVSTVTVVLDRAVDAMGPEDRITLPARFVPRQPPIIAIKRVIDDDDSLTHTTVYC
jgi:hypothetical protein